MPRFAATPAIRTVAPTRDDNGRPSACIYGKGGPIYARNDLIREVSIRWS